MHILVTRPSLIRALQAHQHLHHEDPHALVDRLLNGFFEKDAPWSVNGSWETPLTGKNGRQL